MKRSTANWGKTIFPALFVITIAVLLVLPFRHPHAQAVQPNTSCAVQGAVADACYQIRPAPCTSGQAFWFPNADCHIAEGTDCINPQANPSSGTDGFKYIFAVGPNNATPQAGTFTENPNNGSATLTGHLESTLHPGYGFDVNLQFHGLTTNVFSGMGPFLELDPGCYSSHGGPINPATWHSYNSGTGTLTGTGNYAGAVVELTGVMHNFQVGVGASNKNSLNGMSGWFTWVVTHQPTNSNFCIKQPGDIGNRTADFNLNCSPCSGSIGDFVWQDLNQNGCQDANEPGMSGVQVDLYSGCGNDTTFIRSTTTDQNGHYLFDGLCGGDYSVCFHTPSGFQHTVNNSTCSIGGKPPTETDSNCLSTCTDTTCCVCVHLPNDNGSDLSIDCGYIPQCPLQVTKSCVVPSPSPSATFSCSAMKPISSISQIWNGSQTINIKAWRGQPGSVLLSTQNGITPGSKVTVSGYTGTPNDVVWEIFDASTGNKIGASDFHLSCSDVDMNGPEDCGKAEGDAKGLTGFINQWLFAGMSGANGIKIDCGSPSGTPGTSCVVTPGAAPDCSPAGHPTSLTFKYTGGGCAASNNPQSGKFICSGSVNPALPITVSSSSTGYSLSTTTVNPGGEFTVSASKFAANSLFKLVNAGGTENLSIHTSCSQLLAVGNVFGDLTLVGFNGQRGGNAVTYHYTVKNTSGAAVSGVSLTDDKLGSIAGPFSLNGGETKSFDVTTSVNQTTTNTATASIAGSTCSASSGPVTVTVGPTPTPTPSPSPTPKKGMNNNCTTAGRPNQLKLTYTGGSCSSSMNSQGPPNFSMCQKFCCTEMNGGLTGVSPVHIIVSSSSSTPVTGTQRYFEGDVTAGSQFTVNAGSSSFQANTYIYIFEGGVLKQKVQMHTSCSAPLIRGETFGGVRLDDYAIVQ